MAFLQAYTRFLFLLWSTIRIGLVAGEFSLTPTPDQKQINSLCAYLYSAFHAAESTNSENNRRPSIPLAEAAQWKHKDGELMLLVQVATTSTRALLRSALKANGCTVTGCALFSCSAWMPLERFPEIEALPDVAFLRPSLSQTSQAGSVVSEALQSLEVDMVRANFDPT